MRRSHLLLNIALIISAVVLGAVSANRYLIHHTDSDGPSIPSRLMPGVRLDLKDVDWSKNHRTLVLALSNNCHFCSESAGFYQKLLKEINSSPELHAMAIFSEPLTAAQRYLTDIKVSVDDVRQAPLVKLGLEGTPTLLLIDDSGKITQLWFGRLSPYQEDQVISQVRAVLADKIVTSSSDETNDEIGADEVKNKIRSGQKLIVLDVRTREEYARSHEQWSKNIPSDEIEVRAPNELSLDDFIVTSCRCSDASRSMLARDILVAHGFKKVAVLREQ